jgi:hypothetical protein
LRLRLRLCEKRSTLVLRGAPALFGRLAALELGLPLVGGNDAISLRTGGIEACGALRARGLQHPARVLVKLVENGEDGGELGGEVNAGGSRNAGAAAETIEDRADWSQNLSTSPTGPGSSISTARRGCIRSNP